MDWLVLQMKSLTGRKVVLEGYGDEQRAESLVKAMIEVGLAVGGRGLLAIREYTN